MGKLKIAIANVLLGIAERMYHDEDLGISILREGINYIAPLGIFEGLYDGDDDETGRTSDNADTVAVLPWPTDSRAIDDGVAYPDDENEGLIVDEV